MYSEISAQQHKEGVWGISTSRVFTGRSFLAFSNFCGLENARGSCEASSAALLVVSASSPAFWAAKRSRGTEGIISHFSVGSRLLRVGISGQFRRSPIQYP